MVKFQVLFQLCAVSTHFNKFMRDDYVFRDFGIKNLPRFRTL